MSGLPETIALPDPGTAALRVRVAELEVVAGPDIGKRAIVERPTFVVGTAAHADLRLGDTTASREHVRMSLVPSGLLLRDGGSKNGTWVGGLRISEALCTGDTVLELGTTKIAVRLQPDARDLPLSRASSFGAVIGVSAAMRHLFVILERAAASDVTVLLEGETGVGKEVIARALHEQSLRRAGPFVAVDCGAIPAGLIEAELFGHERGAFTGAGAARSGLFEQADGGTLFVDEIGEMPLELQPKLLRVLETREVRPIGGTSRAVDVRVVAATNRLLAESIERNEFRRDLFYRIAVARLAVPALRDRPEDVIPLAGAFLRKALRDPAAEVPADLAGMLRAYDWPGNVRELRNVIERWALLGARDARSLFDHAERAPAPRGEDLTLLPYHDARRLVLERFEREYLPRVLERAGGVVTKAAELAQIARPSFYRMLERTREDEEPK